MARSTAKVILFSRIKDGNKTVQWPTAVFNTHEDARGFATILSMAHKSGDAKTAQAMDAKTPVDGEGKLITGLRFSIVEVPYSPAASLAASDMLDEPESPTA
jgi:hypothetical protein